MNGSYSCEEMRDLAPELALGIATAEERALALKHLTRCTECREYLEDLSTIADDLMLLAPDREPSVGFESRVMGSFVPEPKGRSWGRATALVAAAALIAGLAAGGVYLSGSPARSAAQRYQRALASGNGKEFSAATLTDARLNKAGQAFYYRGRPSWVFVTVSEAEPVSGTYSVELVTKDGKGIQLGSITYTNGRGSWGRAVNLNVGDIKQLRCLDPRGDIVLEANFPTID